MACRAGLDQADVRLPFFVMAFGFFFQIREFPFAPDGIKQDQFIAFFFVLFIDKNPPCRAGGIVGTGGIRERGIPRLDDGVRISAVSACPNSASSLA